MLTRINQIGRSKITRSSLFVGSLALILIYIFAGNARAFTVNYNPSNLIDNGTLLNNDAMSESDIQTFLTNVGSGLANVQDVEACDSTILSYYSHCGQTISAAQIIYDAAQAYGVNPEAILATLQKEQGLVTQPAPNPSNSSATSSYQASLNCAMGYNSCSNYSGFFTQVDNGTWTLAYNTEGAMRVAKWLSWSPASNYPCSAATSLYSAGLYPGNTVTFTNPGGTAETVTLANAASASLYCYTPYVGPYSQTGYSGSYNFVYYFQLWFGSTQSSTNYAWVIESQGSYIDNGYSQSFTNGISIAPGQTAYLSVTARNVGYQTWQQNETYLGTSNPVGRDSVFANSSWTTPNIISMQQSSVPPGGEATFKFSITAPSKTGTYEEYFNMLAEGITWFNDLGLVYTVNVVQPHQPINSEFQLSAGQSIDGGQYLMSTDTESTLNLESNGDLVLYENYQPVWSNGVSNSSAGFLAMQGDGNLVEYNNSGSPIWASNTQCNSTLNSSSDCSGNYFLSLQNDGNLVIYSPSGGPLWGTGTISVPGHLDMVEQNLPIGNMYPDQSLQTANGLYQLVLQGDGNLVYYGPNGPIWATATNNQSTSRLSMQGDGNLVLYSTSGKPLWASNTQGDGFNSLALQSDGVLALNSGGDGAMLLSHNIYPNQSLTTPNLSNKMVLQGDGNLVLYSWSGTPIWSSNTQGTSAGFLSMQNDGNLVLYSTSGKPLWASNTSGNPGSYLVMQNDGNLVIYSSKHKPIWSSGT